MAARPTATVRSTAEGRPPAGVRPPGAGGPPAGVRPSVRVRPSAGVSSWPAMLGAYPSPPQERVRGQAALPESGQTGEDVPRRQPRDAAERRGIRIAVQGQGVEEAQQLGVQVVLGTTVQTARAWVGPVSYTHLDVYKRQVHVEHSARGG